MGRTTPAWDWFMDQLLLLEPGTENSGTAVNKPGYHGSRAENVVRNGYQDYSVEDAVDRLGPSDASAAGDWTHRSAQSGNYTSMAKYGVRLRRAFNAKDPRLNGWREALGQTDTDSAPEGLDFRGWYTRVPDGSHSWHWHFSESRAYTESYDNKRAMLSILRGETLEQYLANGGVLVTRDGSGVDDMPLSDNDVRRVVEAVFARKTPSGISLNNFVHTVWGRTDYLANQVGIAQGIADIKAEVAKVLAAALDDGDVTVVLDPTALEAVKALEAKLVALEAKVASVAQEAADLVHADLAD